MSLTQTNSLQNEDPDHLQRVGLSFLLLRVTQVNQQNRQKEMMMMMTTTAMMILFPQFDENLEDISLDKHLMQNIRVVQ